MQTAYHNECVVIVYPVSEWKTVKGCVEAICTLSSFSRHHFVGYTH